jgi:hypothetical protein
MDRFYGAPIKVFKDAKLDDGLLDVLILKNLSYLDLAAILPASSPAPIPHSTTSNTFRPAKPKSIAPGGTRGSRTANFSANCPSPSESPHAGCEWWWITRELIFQDRPSDIYTLLYHAASSVLDYVAPPAAPAA